MASVEATAPTVDDAIDSALGQLGLDEDQVELEVLSEGGDGEPARVRATARADVAADIDADDLDADADSELDQVGAELDQGPVEWDENLATAGREIVEDLLDFMGFPGDVDVLRAGKENGTPTLVMAVVDGDSMGALIGRRGETLQAFQFIAQLLINRRVGHWTRVLLDVEGYRSRRERYLKDTALRAAEKAMRYREAIELDPMIPSERRIVHLALAAHEYVNTHSEGEGDSRRVIVEPKADFLKQHGPATAPLERGRPPGGRGGFSRGPRPPGRGRPGLGGGFGRR